jgi:hypothetical protein
MGSKGGNWIAGAIRHKGALHKQLGVPAGKKIPAGKLAKAAKKGGKLGARARLAETLKGMHHGEYGEADTGEADFGKHGYLVKSAVHGMQMGASGFGLSHGASEETEGNEHEYKHSDKNSCKGQDGCKGQGDYG